MDLSQKFKTILIIDQIHPAMTSIYMSFSVSMTIIHSCFFVFQKTQSFILAFLFVFLKLSHQKHRLSYSQDLPESKKWRHFHLLLKYWSAHGTHTHTFIRRHTVRLTTDQSHWQSKPHFIHEEGESINESMMIMYFIV